MGSLLKTSFNNSSLRENFLSVTTSSRQERMKLINVIMIVSVIALAVLAMHGCEAQRREWSRRESNDDICRDFCQNEIKAPTGTLAFHSCLKDCLFVGKLIKKGSFRP